MRASRTGVTGWAIASTEDQRLYEYDRRDKLHFVVVKLMRGQNRTPVYTPSVMLHNMYTNVGR